jgi:hypothetical protein
LQYRFTASVITALAFFVTARSRRLVISRGLPIGSCREVPETIPMVEGEGDGSF